MVLVRRFREGGPLQVTVSQRCIATPGVRRTCEHRESPPRSARGYPPSDGITIRQWRLSFYRRRSPLRTQCPINDYGLLTPRQLWIVRAAKSTCKCEETNNNPSSRQERKTCKQRMAQADGVRSEGTPRVTMRVPATLRSASAPRQALASC